MQRAASEIDRQDRGAAGGSEGDETIWGEGRLWFGGPAKNHNKLQ